MLDFLAKNWWVLVLRGVAAVLFGVMTFVWPVITIAVLVLMWGAYALVDGVFAVIGSFKRGAGQAFPWWLFITGLAGVLAGVFTFVNPALTASALLLLIAAFCIVRGIMQIAAAIRLRDEIDHEWLMGIAGVLSAVFGVMVMIFPGAGAVAIVFWIGALAVAVGVLEIIVGIRLKGHAGKAVPSAA
ncbi:MAG TPA: HdeD family acid-resistance protein [Casimicrobiaceae bacterium]